MPKSPSIAQKKASLCLLDGGQEKFLKEFGALSFSEQTVISRQILSMDFALLSKMRKILQEPAALDTNFGPYASSFKAGSLELRELGKKLLEEGRCGVVIACGGQGSRFGFDKPKGCFPVSRFKQKSLFQIFAEKCKAASLQAGRSLPIAFMTSAPNHAETYGFFAKNNFFGLLPSQVHFFVQPLWPVLDFQGNLFLENRQKIAVGPNGNGAMFSAFVQEGIFRLWKERGIDCVLFLQIDNPLADPFDKELIGFHKSHKLDVTIKAIERQNADEMLGLLSKQKDGKVGVVEYSELPEKIAAKRDELGNLVYKHANISNFCFALPFIERASKLDLPIHPAKKALRKLTQDNQTILPKSPNGWKFEHFIFDALAIAEKVEALVYPREDVFAPLKNFQGDDSIDSVQAALLDADRKAFEKVTGTVLSKDEVSLPFELSLDFYYPTDELYKMWRGRSLPENESYICPNLEGQE